MAGVNWHAAPVGSPLQANITLPVNPKLRVMLTADVTDVPAATLDGESGVAASANPDGVVFARNATPFPISSKTRSSFESPSMSAATTGANPPITRLVKRPVVG